MNNLSENIPYSSYVSKFMIHFLLCREGNPTEDWDKRAKAGEKANGRYSEISLTFRPTDDVNSSSCDYNNNNNAKTEEITTSKYT